MDIRIDNVKGSFKLRVAGILKRDDGKFLVQRVGSNIFYCLPGGHAEVGETLSQAVQRELEEELQFNIQVVRLGFMIENFYFSNKTLSDMHETGFYYYLKSPKKFNCDSWSVQEIDKGVEKVLEYRWVSKDELRDIDFRPSFLKEILLEEPQEFKEYVVRGK